MMAAPMRKHVFANFLKNISNYCPQTHITHSPFRYLRGGRAIRVQPANEEKDSKRKASRKLKFPVGVNPSEKMPKLIRPIPEAGVAKTVEFKGREAKQYHNVPYIELEESDKRFGPVLMLTKSRKYRQKEGKILLEGKRLISDAISAGAEMEALYFSRLTSLDDIPVTSSDAKVYKLKYTSLKNWSDTKSPAGLMGIFRMPKQGEMNYTRSAVVPITLICDNIREPGNMGTLLRSAACAGCKRVLVSKGCVDVWEPKVLRSGAGAHFRIPIITNVDWGMMPNYLNDDSAVYLADTAQEADESDQGKVSAALKMISELEKEQEESLLEAEAEDNDENTDNDSDNDDSDDDKKQKAVYDVRLEAYKHVPMNSKPYSDLNVSKQEVVLVIGGETEGLSAGAYELAYKKFGHKLHVPMCNGTDSLNSAVASSIILFEMQRQYLSSGRKETLHVDSSQN
ncbi:rRNA methyltransferase 3, mitochondrial-like [Lineus longissimus]|uniref:rRNA methyltransferase 3, mitochondrial-like n=1 Tax=Lineus longissimus TaxID=88925 RepID=UPI002B4F4432